MGSSSPDSNAQEFVRSAWVKPPTQIRGLDHLGTQAPGIEIYSQLLPGITNVTDRIRYYSFYAWLFWHFEKRGWNDFETWQRRLRQAECLFALIAIRHGQVSNGQPSDHGGAVVGANTLVEGLSTLYKVGRIRLTDFSHQELHETRTGRYFKNPLGGFGQYYFGALSQLGIFGGQSASEAQLIKPTGTTLAKALEIGGYAPAFFEIIESDELTESDLDKLSGLCPCGLLNNIPERDALLALLMRGSISPSASGGVSENREAISSIEARAFTLSYWQ